MQGANIEAARRLYDECWNEGKLDVLDEVVSEDAAVHDMLMGDIDREAVKQNITMYRKSFPDLEFTVEDSFEAGDKVITRWSVDGTFEEEFMGLEPTHDRGGPPVRGINIDRFAGGKIVETWSAWDALQFMRDVGAVSDSEVPTAG
ncbi:MAG: ester cyclase [Solirubrobacterales bacterium]